MNLNFLKFSVLCLLAAAMFHSHHALSQVQPRLKIGVIVPQTGSLSAYGQQTLNGIRLALSDLKESDPKTADLINILVEDDRSIVENAKDAAERLVQQKRVHLVFGGITSTSSLAIAKVAHDTKHPFLTPSATHLDVTRKSRFVFRSALTDPEQGTYAAHFARRKLKKSTAAILYRDDMPYSEIMMRTFEHRFKKQGGKIVAKQAFNKDTMDLSGPLSRIKRAKPNIIFLPVFYKDTARILSLAKNLAVGAPFLGTDGWNSPGLFRNLDRYVSRGHYFISSYYPTDLESKSKEFMTRYKKAFRDNPTYFSAMAYDGMQTVIDAYRRSKGDLTTAIVRALSSTTNAQGLLGPIRLNRFRNALKTVMVMQTTAAGPKFHSLLSVD